MRNAAVRFAIGAGTGLVFLPVFQFFRLSNWLIGGFLVCMLFGMSAMILGHFANGKQNVPATPVYDGDTLAEMIKEILENVEIESNGMGSYTVKTNAGLDMTIRNIIRKYLHI